MLFQIHSVDFRCRRPKGWQQGWYPVLPDEFSKCRDCLRHMLALIQSEELFIKQRLCLSAGRNGANLRNNFIAENPAECAVRSANRLHPASTPNLPTFASLVQMSLLIFLPSNHDFLLSWFARH